MHLHRSFFQKQQALITSVIFFLAFVILHGYSFFSFSLVFDDIQDFYGHWIPTYIAQDRWGHAAYRMLLGEGTAIWAAGLASAMWLSLALFCQIKLFKISNFMECVLFSMLNLACAQFSLILNFMQHADAIAFAMFAASLAVLLLFRMKSCWRFIIFVSLICISISCYQTILFYTLILMLASYWIILQEGRRLAISDLIRSGFLLIGATLMWYAISMICKSYTPEWAITYAKNYHSSRSQLAGFIEIGIWSKILYLGHYGKKVIITACGSLENGRWIYSLALLPMCYVSYHTLRMWREAKLYLGVLIPFTIWVLPFALLIILGAEQPPRTFLAEPLALATLSLLAWRTMPKQLSLNLTTRYISLILLAMLYLYSFYRVSAQEKFDIARYEELQQLLRSVDAVRIARTQQHQQIYHVQIAAFNDGQRDLMTPISGIAKHLHLQHITTVEAKYEHRLQHLNSWPAPNSVEEVSDGLLIIRYDYKNTTHVSR